MILVADREIDLPLRDCLSSKFSGVFVQGDRPRLLEGPAVRGGGAWWCSARNRRSMLIGRRRATPRVFAAGCLLAVLTTGGGGLKAAAASTLNVRGGRGGRAG